VTDDVRDQRLTLLEDQVNALEQLTLAVLQGVRAVQDGLTEGFRSLGREIAKLKREAEEAKRGDGS
jgi:hypothetical protein